MEYCQAFLTNKSCISNNFISVEQDGDLISNEKELVKLFNQNYINTVETSSGKKPSSLGDCLNVFQEEVTFQEFSNHQYLVTIQSFKK